MNQALAGFVLMVIALLVFLVLGSGGLLGVPCQHLAKIILSWV